VLSPDNINTLKYIFEIDWITFVFKLWLCFLFIFLEKTKQKIVVALESLRFQGRSPRQAR